MAKQNTISQIQLPDGTIYDIEATVEAIVNTEIDAICNSFVTIADEEIEF